MARFLLADAVTMRDRSALLRGPGLIALAAIPLACVIPIGDQTTDDGGGLATRPDASVLVGDSGATVTVDGASPSGDGAGLLAQSMWTTVTSNLAGIVSQCGTLTYVSTKPDEDTVIAGVAGVGLFASLNGATDWSPLGSATDAGLNAAGGELFPNRTAQMVYDPDHHSTYWQSGNYGPCAYKTTDDGATFTQLGSAMLCDSLSIDFTDTDRKTILAGGHESHSVFRSTDQGQTWTDIGANVPKASGDNGFALVLSPQVHLLGTWNGAADGIYRTTDGGATWAQVFSGGIRSRPLVLKDGTIYWVLSNLESNSGLVKSVDQGVTWAKVAGSESIVSTEQGLVLLPNGSFATAGPSGLIVSSDQGSTWTSVGPNFPFSPWGVAFSAFRNTFYIWHFDCNAGPNDVAVDAIASLGVTFL